jgi:hypothetical protein
MNLAPRDLNGLSDGSALLLAVQEWLTLAGRVIWHQGVVPDIEGTLPPTAHLLLPLTEAGMTPDQLQATEDEQVLSALELLAPPSESAKVDLERHETRIAGMAAGHRFVAQCRSRTAQANSSVKCFGVQEEVELTIQVNANHTQ